MDRTGGGKKKVSVSVIEGKQACTTWHEAFNGLDLMDLTFDWILSLESKSLLGQQIPKKEEEVTSGLDRGDRG